MLEVGGVDDHAGHQVGRDGAVARVERHAQGAGSSSVTISHVAAAVGSIQSTSAEARVRDVVVDVHDGHPAEQLGVLGQHRVRRARGRRSRRPRSGRSRGRGRAPCRKRSMRGMKSYIGGTGSAHTGVARPPSDSTTRASASAEPSASASGFSWQTVSTVRARARSAPRPRRARRRRRRWSGPSRRWMAVARSRGRRRCIGVEASGSMAAALELCRALWASAASRSSEPGPVRARLELVEDGSTRVPARRCRQPARAAPGCASDAKLAQAMAHEGHRPPQGPQGRLAARPRVADDRDPDRGVAQVGGDFDARDGHEADARVLDLAAR